MNPFDLVIKNQPPTGIICKPVSDTIPAGNGEEFVDFTNLVTPYTKNVGSDKLTGGNCVWVRQSDGLVLSWQGPFGFNVAPRPSIVNDGAAAPVLDGYASREGPQVDFAGQAMRVYNFSRFFSNVRVHGKSRSTGLQIVLGVGMINNTVVCVVEQSETIINILYGTLSEIKTIGWRSATPVVKPVRAGQTHLFFSNCFSFSQNGLNIIGLSDSVYDSVAPGEVNTKKFFRRDIVRISLAIDVLGVVSVLSSSFEVFDDFESRTDTTTANLTKNDTSGDPCANGEFDVDFDSSVAYALPTDTLIEAVGMFGNTEKIVKWDITHSRTQTVTATYDAIGYGVGIPTTGHDGVYFFSSSINWSASLLSGAVILFSGEITETVTRNNSEAQVSSPFTLNAIHNTSLVTRDCQLVFADIAANEYVLLETITDSVSNLNRDVLNGVVTLTGTGRTDNVLVQLTSSTSGILQVILDDSRFFTLGQLLLSPEHYGVAVVFCDAVSGQTVTVVERAPALDVQYPFLDFKFFTLLDAFNYMIGSSEWAAPDLQQLTLTNDGFIGSLTPATVADNINFLPGAHTPETLFGITGNKINLIGSMTYVFNDIRLYRI